jgi:hypothetical protein
MDGLKPENRQLLESRYRITVWVIYTQILLTLLLTIVAWQIVSKTEFTTTNQSLTMLWVAIIFIAIISFVLRRLFFNWERLRNLALLKGISGVLGNLQINSIVLGAFAEIVAILGFVITILSGNSFDMLRASAIALIVFYINFPRKKVWHRIVVNLQEV